MAGLSNESIKETILKYIIGNIPVVAETLNSINFPDEIKVVIESQQNKLVEFINAYNTFISSQEVARQTITNFINELNIPHVVMLE